jgi:hypothetical protein
MTGGVEVSAGLVAAVAEAVVVEAAAGEAVVVEAAVAPPVDTRLDLVLLWHIAGIVAVAARRRRLAGRSFIFIHLLVKRELEIQQWRRKTRRPAGV